jgi:membrane-associated phospholipid phosphatase
MRRRQLLAAGLCAAAAAAVWAAAFHVGAVETADVRLYARLLGLGGVRWMHLARDLTGFFDPAPYAVLSASLVAGAVALRRRREALVAAVLLAGSAVTTQLLKPALAEQHGTFALPPSWPSGHTTAVVSLAAALVIVAPPARRRLVALAGAAVSAATGLALVVLGSHYPSDVAGGVFVAVAWACLAATGLAAPARLPQRLRAPRGDVEAA